MAFTTHLCQEVIFVIKHFKINCVLNLFQTLEEPPYLTVGTDVSAKYRGAFCEAKIKSAKRLVKAKVSPSVESRKPTVRKVEVCVGGEDVCSRAPCCGAASIKI